MLIRIFPIDILEAYLINEEYFWHIHYLFQSALYAMKWVKIMIIIFVLIYIIM